MNVHEKNYNLLNRVEELQKTTKEFMLKNISLNTKFDQ
jgi:hypothetical protein